MKVQNMLNTETAGISQPQTLAQKLRYELEVQEVGADGRARACTHSQRQTTLVPPSLDIARILLT